MFHYLTKGISFVVEIRYFFNGTKPYHTIKGKSPFTCSIIIGNNFYIVLELKTNLIIEGNIIYFHAFNSGVKKDRLTIIAKRYWNDVRHFVLAQSQSANLGFRYDLLNQIIILNFLIFPSHFNLMHLFLLKKKTLPDLKVFVR